MSPFNLPQLPTGGSYSSDVLFNTEPGIPFVDDTESLYEKETNDPYKETAPFSTLPISQEETTYELPKTVAQPRQEGALERYMRAQKEEEEAKRQQQVTEKSAFDLANRDYLQRRSVFDQSSLELAVEIQSVNKAKKEAFNESFQKDFGWLNGQEHPDWPEYISENYPNWQELTPAQRDDVFEHWKDNESKYFVGYSNVNPEVFQKKFSDKWFNDPENQEIVDNKIFVAQEKLKTVPSLSIPFTKSFGYDAGDSIDSSFYKTNKAGLMAARGFKSMSEMAESVNKIQKRTGVNILNEDGTINVEKVKQARQEHNAQIQELKNVDAYDPEADDLSANFDNLVGYTNTTDPNKKWNDVKTAVKSLNEIQSLLNIKEKKFNESIENSDGFFETAWSFLSEPGTSARFFGGQFAAQMIDTAPETLGAAAAGGPIVGYLASGFIGGSQEERLVAKELITEAMVKKGYDPDNIADWQKASEEKDDIITNAKNAARRKGYNTTPVENALELVFFAALRGTKFSGKFAKTRKGLSYLTAGGVAAAGGEVRGQMAAYGEVDTGEVAAEVIGNIFGLAGPATFNAAGRIGQKVFGKKDETQTTTSPQATTDPQAPTAETTTRPKTQEEIALEKEQARRNVKATGTQQEGTGTDTTNAQEDGTEGNGQRTESVTGAGQQAVASPAQQSAEVILNPDTPTTTRTAVELERISRELDALENNLNATEETFRQSPEQAQLLADQLRQQELNLTDEEFNQLSIIRNLSPAEREGYTANTLRKIAVKNQPVLTEQELKQMEFLKLLSPEERKMYGEFQAGKAASQSRSLINQTLAKRLEKRLALEEALKEKFSQFQTDLRQSETGMELLRKQLAEEERAAEAGKKGKPRTAQESFETEANPNEQFRQAFTPKSIDEIIGLSRQLETEPYVAPKSDIPASEFSTLLEQEVNTLPDKAKSKWTPEVFAAANEYYNTLNEDVLAGLEKPQRNRVISLYYGTIEERDAKKKGMSVEQAFNKRRNQGGFLDIPALGQGVADAAVTAWTKAKDFATWSAEMVENFGNKAVPYLRDLWNRLNSLIRNVGDFLTYTPNARARQRGSVDLRRSVDLRQDEEVQLEGADMARAMDMFGSSLYSSNLEKTVGKEIFQNGVDAIMKSGKEKKVFLADTEDKTSFFYDNGSGMSPSLILNKFLRAFVSGKDVGEGGGFGLAKLAFLGSPKRFKIFTISVDENGKKVLSTLEGTGKGFLAFNSKPPKINIKPDTKLQLAGNSLTLEFTNKIPKESETGTYIEIEFNEGQNPWNAKAFIDDAAKWVPDLNTGYLYEKDNDNPPLKALEYAGKRESKISEEGNALTLLSSVSTPAADIDFISKDGSKIAKTQYPWIKVLNRGILQFTINVQLPEQVALPDQLAVNIKPKVKAGSADYPFTTNREQLTGDVLKEVTAYFSDIGTKALQNLNNKYANALNDAVLIPSTNNVLLDAGSSVPQDVLEKIVNNDVTITVNEDVAKIQNAILKMLSKKFSGKISQFNRAKYAGLLTGANAFGVHFGKPGTQEPSSIYHDIWLEMELAAREYDDLLASDFFPTRNVNSKDLYDVFLTKVAGVSFHEALHQFVNSEAEPLARELTFKAGDIVQTVVDLISTDHDENTTDTIVTRLTEQKKELDKWKNTDQAGEFITSQGGYDGYAFAAQRNEGAREDGRSVTALKSQRDADYAAAEAEGDEDVGQRMVDAAQGETRILLTPEEKKLAQWMVDGPMGEVESISEVLERRVLENELPKIEGEYLVLSSGEFVRDAEYRIGTQLEDMINDALSDDSISKTEASKQRRAARSLTSKLSSKLQDPFTYDDQGKLIPLSQRFNTQSNDTRFSRPQRNPNVGTNQTRASLIRKAKKFFGGTIPNNVSFISDRSQTFVARIDVALTGQGNIIINEAFADDSNIESALNEEIGHFASNRGLLKDFYNELTPEEKQDIDTALLAYGESEARMSERSVDALQAEERLAKAFAAIASRNKDLWTRIKNLVNKILAKLGLAPANTDNQVADIFLKAMTAYKNQRENRPDFSNRRINTQGKTSFYSKVSAREEIDKAMDKIKESKDSPVRSLFQSINLSHLSKEARKELQDRMKAYADATKAVVRGKEILNPQESKQRFDELIQYLSDFKKTAWEDQFKKLQEKYPSSLKDKTADKFTSAKAVTAYVANLNNADSKKIIEDQKKKADKKREATERKDESEGAQVTLALEAQSNINEILDTAPYKEMASDHKIWTMEAMEYLETLDPTQQTQRQNEALVATINSAIEGNIIGFGKYTAARRIQMFLVDLNAYIKDNGGKIPWYTAAETRRIRRGVENFVSSETASQFFKKETIEKMIFSHPELRRMWVKNLGDYLEKVQTANSSLQNELDKKLQTSFEKHGLKEKTFAGNVKDRQLFSDKTRKSKARMMVAAMITQWTDGSNDPIAEINNAINDILIGINNEINIKAFSGARGVSNLDSFNSLINPLIKDGFLIRNENKFEAQATPEVWNEAVLNALQENERNALIEIRNTASLLQDNLKFTKEFWYGEEFEAVVNYVPKQAYSTSPDIKEESAPELNEGSSAPLPENPSLRRQGSVLFARQGLGKDQYYTLDIERAATKAIKSAAYEVTTAPERIMMHEAFNNDELLPYFGNQNSSSKSRRSTMRETLKAVHKAEMHLGTAAKRPTSTEGIVLSKAGEMFTTLIGAQMLGKVKNIASQYLAPIAGSTILAGQDIFNGMVQLNTNDEWKANNGEAIKALYAIGFPDLEHRSEIIDFFYDVSSNSDLVRDIAKISLDENLNDEQKTDVIVAKVVAAIDAGISVPKYISQMVNTKPDAWAAKHVFPGLLINRLKQAGVINKADEFVPAVMNDPRAADALSKAKQDMSTAFGNANRYSLRPEFFVDKSKNGFIRNTLFSVAQTATSMAGDVVVAAKDAFYFNSADKYASEIRKEGAKRLAAIGLQTYVFAFISKVFTLQVLKYGALLFGKAEGLDEEEEKELRNRIAINQELGMQDISQRAMSDMLSNTMGFIGTNSAGKFVSNIASKKVMEKLLYADYEEKKKELEDKINKEKNPSRKADLQFQLELIKQGKKKLNIVFDEPNFGPTVESFIDTLRGIDDPTQADFDAFAEEYYKRGGLEKKPERNAALRYLGKAAGYAIPDIGSARAEVYKARKEVADKRESKLNAKEQKNKKNIDKINIPLISYP